MNDLRQRLAEALSGEVKATWHPPAGTVVNGWHIDFGDMPDAVLEVFAAWLRERAGEHRDCLRSGPSRAVVRWADDEARRYERLADEISPKEQT